MNVLPEVRQSEVVHEADNWAAELDEGLVVVVRTITAPVISLVSLMALSCPLNSRKVLIR
jgi:hypothetical protein